MTSLHNKLLKLFRIAAKLNESLWGAGIDSASMSPKQLAEHVTGIAGIELEYYAVDVENDHVFGFIEIYELGKKAKIYISKNISDRFKHAVIAKELCQPLIDTPDDWQTDGIDTLQKLLGQTIEIDAPEYIAYRSEALAERLSWELLYPFELRTKDLADGTPFEVIAARVRLPLQIVELLLSPGDVAWCRRWWEVILAEHDAKTAAAKAAE